MQKMVLIEEAELRQLISQIVKSELATLPKVEPEEVLTRKQACELLKISMPTLHQWKTAGHIPSHRKGGRVFFKKSELISSLSKTKTAAEL